MYHITLTSASHIVSIQKIPVEWANSKNNQSNYFWNLLIEQVSFEYYVWSTLLDDQSHRYKNLKHKESAIKFTNTDQVLTLC